MSFTQDGKKLIYQAPHICYTHNFITMNKMEFFRHAQEVPHEQAGTHGVCESCGKYLPSFKVPYRGISEPTLILCTECERIPNIVNIIRDKRKSVYLLLPIEEQG